MLLYGLWSQGASYYATHVGTVVCCYGDCQGSWGIIGVYPRQEQGYSPSIRTRFNLPHGSDHTSGSTQSHRDKERRQQRRQPRAAVLQQMDCSASMFLEERPCSNSRLELLV